MRISNHHTPTSRRRRAATTATPAETPQTDDGNKKKIEVVSKVLGAACVASGAITAGRIVADVASTPGLAGKVALGAGAVAAAAAGLVAADFASGVFHWTIDNYPDKDTPIVGKLAEDFQNHHQASGMDHVSVWENIAPAAGAFVLPLAGLAAFTPHPILAAAGLTFTGGAVLAQASHRWSHMTSPPTAARFLQKLHISQSAENHARHHEDPYDENYCIVNGSLNGVLARTNFWRKMEHGVFKLTGAEPNSWKDPKVKALALGQTTKAELEQTSRS